MCKGPEAGKDPVLEELTERTQCGWPPSQGTGPRRGGWRDGEGPISPPGSR